MAIITTTEICRECAEKGVQARLNRDLLSDEYFCAQGHKFHWDPASFSMVALGAGGKQPDATAEAQPPQEAESPMAAVAEAPAALQAQSEALSELSEFGQIQNPPAIPETADPVSIPTARQLGGDAIVSVRIPERHVQALRAEAENQGVAWEQFLQQRFEWSLDQGIF